MIIEHKKESVAPHECNDSSTLATSQVEQGEAQAVGLLRKAAHIRGEMSFESHPDDPTRSREEQIADLWTAMDAGAKWHSEKKETRDTQLDLSLRRELRPSHGI